MKCKGCGRELKEYELICPTCGTEAKEGSSETIIEKLKSLGGGKFSALFTKDEQYERLKNLEHFKSVQYLVSATIVLLVFSYTLLSAKQFTVTYLYGLHADLNLFEALETNARPLFFLLYLADVVLIEYPFVVGFTQKKPKKLLMTLMRLSGIGCWVALGTFIALWSQLDEVSGYFGELASLSLSFFGWMFILISVAEIILSFIMCYHFDKLIDEAYAMPQQSEDSTDVTE